VIFDLAPGFMIWEEVDPGRHPFDSATAAQVVHSLGWRRAHDEGDFGGEPVGHWC
jgi:hypothetical protein